MVRVSGLYRIALRVSDLDALGTFYQKHWHMQLVHADERQCMLRSSSADHSDLILMKDSTNQLDHVAFSVESEADLRLLLDRVERAAVEVIEKPRPGERTGELLVAAIRDLDGTRIDLVVPSAERLTTGEAPQVGPMHLGHVVLWTPQIEAQEAFYALLGFQVSDRTHMGMSFLRCNRDHHSLALMRNSHGRAGLQHVAFDVGSIDQVMREYGRLRREGVSCIWGVGRHGPGNNVFSYYCDPAGNIIEYYGEMETVATADVIHPRYWGPQHKGDVWELVGPAPSPFRG